MEITAFGPRYYSDELKDGDFDKAVSAIRSLNEIKFRIISGEPRTFNVREDS